MAESTDQPAQRENLILIGLSTGGPKFLKQMFKRYQPLRKDHVVIIQHMPEGIGADYARRLSEILQRPVRLAASGDEVAAHPFLLCPGDHHLSFSQSASGKAYCRITKAKMNYIYQPSIDLAVASSASVADFHKYVIILTGMGADGSSGLAKLQKSEFIGLAQDPAEAIAPGMPNAAIATGKIDRVLKVDDIAAFLNARKGKSVAA
jgi:two-component system chemotaxis response regulator CheB